MNRRRFLAFMGMGAASAALPLPRYETGGVLKGPPRPVIIKGAEALQDWLGRGTKIDGGKIVSGTIRATNLKIEGNHDLKIGELTVETDGYHHT